MQQSEAERKFWETPELLETLFLTLDLESALSLARLLDQENLQAPAQHDFQGLEQTGQPELSQC